MEHTLRISTSFLAIALCLIGAAPGSAWGATCSVSFQVAQDTFGNPRLIPGTISGDEDCPEKPIPYQAVKKTEEYRQANLYCSKINVRYTPIFSEATCLASPSKKGIF